MKLEADSFSHRPGTIELIPSQLLLRLLELGVHRWVRDPTHRTHLSSRCKCVCVCLKGYGFLDPLASLAVSAMIGKIGAFPTACP